MHNIIFSGVNTRQRKKKEWSAPAHDRHRCRVKAYYNYWVNRTGFMQQIYSKCIFPWLESSYNLRIINAQEMRAVPLNWVIEPKAGSEFLTFCTLSETTKATSSKCSMIVKKLTWYQSNRHRPLIPNRHDLIASRILMGTLSFTWALRRERSWF